MNLYTTGTMVRCQARFTDPTSCQLVDPATVTFLWKDPNGVQNSMIYGTDTNITKTGTGCYTALVSANIDGSWLYRFEATGVYQAAAEGSFDAQSDF